MKGTTWWVAAGLTLGLLLGGCGGSESEPVEEPVRTEEQIQAEQEAARRQEAVSGFEQSAAALSGDLSGLLDGVADLPEDLQRTLDGLRSRLDAVERRLGELKQSGSDSWERALAGVESAMQAVRSAHDQAAGAVSEWRSRKQAVLEERQQKGLPIDPKTGLLLGLDGGEYSHYKASVVERVKGQLRRLGLYAGPLDDVFDRALLEAVGRFQKSTGLGVSGVPSPPTRGRLAALEAGD